MSAMSSVEWRILPFSTRNFGPPKLLFKFITHSDGFDLYVTDIVHCWKESRDRPSIAKEAAKSRSSIDPNEDPGQLDVLLSKLRDGLMGSRGGRCKIGSLHHNKQEDRSFWGFRILTRTPLPAPLQPLLWTFQLVQERHMLLTRELLLPALSSELKYRMQVEELRRKIEEKDHVITRLMDKIEQSSMDLSLVFPGYSTGRRGLKAQQAVKIVPGLSKFDGVGWQKAHADDQLATTRSLVETISKPGAHQLSFEAPHNPYDGDAGWEPFGAAGEWLEDWIEREYHDPTFTDLEESTDGKLHGAHSVPKLPVEESSSAFENVSQIDGTKHRPTDPLVPSSHSSTSQRAYSTSSDESQTQLSRTKGPRIGNVAQHQSKFPRIPASSVDNHRASFASSPSDSDSPLPQRRPKKPSRLGTLGGKRKAPDATKSAQSPSALAVSPNHSNPSRKLGTLGGKKDHTKHSSSPTLSHSQPPVSASQHTPSRKLGVLGGRNKLTMLQEKDTTLKLAARHPVHEDDLEATDSLSPSPSRVPPSDPPTPRKASRARASVEAEDEPATVEALADRKREELKRTLDAGGGKKKKRKF